MHMSGSRAVAIFFRVIMIGACVAKPFATGKQWAFGSTVTWPLPEYNHYAVNK